MKPYEVTYIIAKENYFIRWKMIIETDDVIKGIWENEFLIKIMGKPIKVRSLVYDHK